MPRASLLASASQNARSAPSSAIARSYRQCEGLVRGLGRRRCVVVQPGCLRQQLRGPVLHDQVDSARVGSRQGGKQAARRGRLFRLARQFGPVACQAGRQLSMARLRYDGR